MENAKPDGITEEMLMELRARVQITADGLEDDALDEYRATGRLSSAKLCEKYLEYENMVLELSTLEELKKKCE